jgi:hypothetical protein
LKKRTLFVSVLLCVLVAGLTGCRSRGINITITNTGSQPIRNIELDYPGGTFGSAAIQPNDSFHYRVKILGDGQMKLLFQESNGREHHENGPEVRAGDDGEMTVAIDKDGNNTWKANVQGK